MDHIDDEKSADPTIAESHALAANESNGMTTDEAPGSEIDFVPGTQILAQDDELTDGVAEADLSGVAASGGTAPPRSSPPDRPTP